jgi:hypothetical protein
MATAYETAAAVYTAVGQSGVSFEPGTLLAATEALRTLGTFNRAQVAYLVALAYERGRVHAASEDIAEAVACWREFADPEVTREERVQRRHAQMLAGMVRVANRPASPRLHLVGDWPEVKQPGTADATYFAQIGRPAQCACERRVEPHWLDGYHRTPDAFPTRYTQERELLVAA